MINKLFVSGIPLIDYEVLREKILKRYDVILTPADDIDDKDKDVNVC